MFSMKSRSFVLFAALVAVLAFVAACGPTPTPEVVTVVETVEVERTVEVEKVVEKEIPVTVEVEREVVVTATPTPTPTPTPEPVVIIKTVVVTETVEVEKIVEKEVVVTATPEPSKAPVEVVETQIPANVVATWTITKDYDLPVEGYDDPQHFEYEYTAVLVTDTLRLPNAQGELEDKTYGFLNFTRSDRSYQEMLQGIGEEPRPSLEVVLDDQAMAHLVWVWSHDENPGPTLETLEELHTVYRNERPETSGNNLSETKGWGWFITTEAELESRFHNEKPEVGAIAQAVMLGPEMANYDRALEKEGLLAWARWHEHRGVEFEKLGVYEPF